MSSDFLLSKVLSIFSVSLILLSFGACDKASIEDNGKLPKANETIREASKSLDGIHQISTFVTRTSGMGVLVDGESKEFDDFAVRYCPAITNSGEYAWIEQMPGKGYDVIWNNQSICHSSSCFNHLTAGSTKALVVESENSKDQTTRLYLIDMVTGTSEVIASLKGEYIEEVSSFANDEFGVITCFFDSNGNKLYNIYAVNGITRNVKKVSENIAKLVTFPIQKDAASDKMEVDFYDIQDNDRYLFNALRIFCEGNDAFAYGNNFRGRLTWDESYRLRGLWELYNKTHEPIFKDRIDNVISALLHATNQYTGIASSDWNPSFTWSSKCYSLDYEPVALLVLDAEIISAMLMVCNLGGGAGNNKEVIISQAKKIYNYYEPLYDKGHYHLPKGMPMWFDGIEVPYNYQNAMAEVALGLYWETREQKYLDRCNELLTTFVAEWTIENNRVLWHYWPLSYYAGWEDDGRSVHTPSSSPSTDKAYEDASHAGISVRLICKYLENVPNGVIRDEIKQKIESNMTYFCSNSGFSKFISGYVTTNNPRAWHYWISPYFTYLHNTDFEKYVRQGYLKCFPSWDSQGALFANAKLYVPTYSGSINVERKELGDDSKWISIKKFELNNSQLYEYLGIKTK